MTEITSAIKIVIASGVKGDTRRYRTFHLYEQCRLLGMKVDLTHVTAGGFQASANQANLLILHRAPWDENIQHAISVVHEQGGRVIYDIDDLLFDPTAIQWIDSPDFADPLRVQLYVEDILRHQRTMGLCDGILTSTDYLAGLAKKFNKPTFVHRNSFSNEMLLAASRVLENRKSDSHKITIGYASGTLTHNRDIEYIGPVLRMLLEKNVNISLWLIGPLKLNREWEKFKKQIIRLPHVPWRMLPGYLARFDINLAPLVVDNPFAQSKSEIKWMEAALVQVPTVASTTGAFKTAIKNGQSGFLANTQDEWLATLSRLVDDQKLRQAVGMQAYDQVIQDYSPQARSQEFIKIIRHFYPGFLIVTDKKPRDDHSRVNGASGSQTTIYNEANPSLLGMAMYNLKYRGLSTLIRQVRVYFRRMLSRIIPYRKIRDH